MPIESSTKTGVVRGTASPASSTTYTRRSNSGKVVETSRIIVYRSTLNDEIKVTYNATERPRDFPVGFGSGDTYTSEASRGARLAQTNETVPGSYWMSRTGRSFDPDLSSEILTNSIEPGTCFVSSKTTSMLNGLFETAFQADENGGSVRMGSLPREWGLVIKNIDTGEQQVVMDSNEPAAPGYVKTTSRSFSVRVSGEPNDRYLAWIRKGQQDVQLALFRGPLFQRG